MIMLQVLEGTAVSFKVNIMSNKKKAMLTIDVPLSSYLADYVLYIGQFLLDLASLKSFFKLVAFYWVVKDRFSTKSEPMKSATTFLPISILSYVNSERQKYSSLYSKLELKGLVKPETASSTCSSLHLSRLDISLQCIEELF